MRFVWSAAGIVLLCAAECAAVPTVAPLNHANDAPVFGILTEPTSGAKTKFGTEYLAASYVKYLESAGARVVPIRYTASESELDQIFNSINGILLPGGGVDLGKTTQFYKTGKYLYDKVIQANDAGDVFPLWGTCLGFEFLNILTSDDEGILGSFDAENISLPLDFTKLARSSRMFGHLPDQLVSILATEPVTMNNHMSGVEVQAFHSNAKLSSFYNVLSTNVDRQGKAFVSSIEGKSYPVFGTQWHPEKNQFEWNPEEGINHSAEGIAVMQSMADFLVDMGRFNKHSFASEADLEKAVIYNDNAKYTGGPGQSFEQCYFW